MLKKTYSRIFLEGIFEVIQAREFLPPQVVLSCLKSHKNSIYCVRTNIQKP
jgi:hypothetical protein